MVQPAPVQLMDQLTHQARHLVTIIALVSMLACEPAWPDAVKDVEAATQHWTAALNKGNAKEIVKLYAIDAVFFGFRLTQGFDLIERLGHTERGVLVAQLGDLFLDGE